MSSRQSRSRIVVSAGSQAYFKRRRVAMWVLVNDLFNCERHYEFSTTLVITPTPMGSINARIINVKAHECEAVSMRASSMKTPQWFQRKFSVSH